MRSFDAYRHGLQGLVHRLGRDHQDYTEALTLQARLEENIAGAQEYGDDETRRAGRMQILDALNTLARRALGVSFNEMCGLQEPPTPLASPLCPFVAGPKITDPHLFVGRKDELRRLVSAMEGAQPISVNVAGERRIGKSSLLYHLYQTWEQRVQAPERYVVIYLSLQDAAAQAERELYQTIAQTLLARPAIQRSAALSSVLGKRPLGRREFAEAMRTFQTQALLPVLCLDEFEALFNHPRQFDNSFYDALRALMDDSALMLIAASLKPLDVYRRRHRLTSSFFNLGHLLQLGELTEEEATDLVRLPASTVRGAPAALSLEEQRLARQWGGRHPCLLQLAGGFLYQARQEGKDVAWARERFQAEARRVPCPGLRLRRLWRPLRWLVWSLPARLGRLARGVGGAVDEMTNWLTGVVIVIVVILVVLGILNASQIVELLRRVLGGP